MKLLVSTATALLCASVTACAPSMAVSHQPLPRTLPADLQLGRLAERTTFEQTDASGDPLGGSADLHDAKEDQRKRKGAFIGGVAAAAIGGAMAVGFGAAGQITENQLSDGYAEGMTREEESDLTDRGEAFNSVAIAGGALAVAGLVLTAVVLGIDHRRCGNLIKSRRKACRQQISR